MVRHRLRIVASLALGMAALGFQVPLAATTASACGTYVDGVCVVPPQPVIVDPGTGPVLVDGLVQTATLTLDDVEGDVSAVITDTSGVSTPVLPPPAASTDSTTDLNAGVVDANAPSNGDSHNYGTCSSQATCTDLKLYEPTYNINFNPHDDFHGTGTSAISVLVPADSQNYRYWVWTEHAGITSQGSYLQILTNSVEMSGNGLHLVDWSPDVNQGTGSGTTNTYSVSYSGFSASSSFTDYDGEVVGETYNSSTGYVASWRNQGSEYGAGDGVTIALRDGVIWSQPYNNAAHFKIETRVWYEDS